MAKHSVPKKKTSKARTSRRFKSFQNRARVLLSNAIKLSPCPSCGTLTRVHHACVECGNYRGNNIKKEKEGGSKEPVKVTTVKAD